MTPSDPNTLSQTLWLIGLSSAAGSAIISGIILGWFNLRAKRNEFVNDYHKLVIQRRIAVYEQLELLIFLIKSVSVDRGDARPYHLVFGMDNPDTAIYTPLMFLAGNSLWLSNKAFDISRRFNILMHGLPTEDQAAAVEFGKAHHQELARIREELENVLADDMRTLYKVKQFLKSKKKAPAEFQPVYLEHPPQPANEPH
jgi:hypothetical protein